MTVTEKLLIFAITNSAWMLLHISSVQLSHSVMFDSLQPHGLQHARLACPSPTSRVCSNSCPSSQWCHPTISSSVAPFPSPSIFPNIRIFPKESALHSRWPKYWSFSLNPSNEYLELIPFRIDWFNLPAVQETLERLLQHHSSKVSIFLLSLLYGPALTSIDDYWKNHSFDYMDLCWQSDVSAF